MVRKRTGHCGKGCRRAIALSLAALAVAAQARAATVTTHPRPGAFSALRLFGRFHLDFAESARETVSLTGNRYVIDALLVSASRGVLGIVRPSGFYMPKHQTVVVTVTAPSLTSLDLRGRIRAKLSGLTGKTFSLDNHGAAAATLSGSVRRLDIASRGVVSIDAGALHARDLKVEVRGQGNLRVFASHSAIVDMYGEGRVDVLGHPPIRQFKAMAYGVVSSK